MICMVRSEWRKLWSIPILWWLLLATVLVLPVAVVGGFLVADLNNVALNSGEGLEDGLHGVGFGSVLAEIAGIIAMAGEFRFGQADQTFLSEPRRSRVVTAKLAVVAVVGAVFGLVGAGITLGTSWIWLTIKGVGLPMGQSILWETLSGAVASAVLFAWLGLGVGAALRNQVVALVTVLGVQTVLEQTIFSASTTVGRWLPAQASEALRQVPAPGLLSVGAGAAVLAAWVAGVVVVGYVRTVRGDITVKA
jgi:ABC-2 type transport system permease protein